MKFLLFAFAFYVGVLGVGQTLAFADDAIVLKPFERKGAVGKTLTASVHRVAFSPNGKLLACSSRTDNTIKLYDTATWRVNRKLGLHLTEVESLGFSADSRLLASASFDLLVVRDLETKKLVGKFYRSKDSPLGVLESVQFLADGKRMVTEGVWDSDEGEQQSGFEIWDLATKKLLMTIEAPGQKAISSDGSVIAALDYTEDRLHIWETTGDKKKRSYKLPFNAGLYSTAFSPDGKTIATDANDSRIGFVDVATGKARKTTEKHDVTLSRLTFSADGKFIASCSDDLTVRIWDVGSGAVVQKLVGHEKEPLDAAFAPDGRTLATGDVGGSLRIWKIDGAKKTK